MKTMNKIQLIGYLGAEPIIRNCKNGSKIAVLRLATHLRINHDRRETYQSTWHQIAVWGEERIARLGAVMTGSHLMIEGRLEYKTYFDRNGHKRYVTEINAFSFTDLDR